MPPRSASVRRSRAVRRLQSARSAALSWSARRSVDAARRTRAPLRRRRRRVLGAREIKPASPRLRGRQGEARRRLVRRRVHRARTRTSGPSSRRAGAPRSSTPRCDTACSRERRDAALRRRAAAQRARRLGVGSVGLRRGGAAASKGDAGIGTGSRAASSRAGRRPAVVGADLARVDGRRRPSDDVRGGRLRRGGGLPPLRRRPRAGHPALQTSPPQWPPPPRPRLALAALVGKCGVGDGEVVQDRPTRTSVGGGGVAEEDDACVSGMLSRPRSARFASRDRDRGINFSQGRIAMKARPQPPTPRARHRWARERREAGRRRDAVLKSRTASTSAAPPLYASHARFRSKNK